MQQELRVLISQKDQIEKDLLQLSKQIEDLEQTYNYQQGLVDNEGFPRADLDFGNLASYRTLKRKKNQLNNDHQALMKIIEQKLYALHASYPQTQTSSQTKQPKGTFLKVKEKIESKEPEKKQHKIDYLTPFAQITLVEAHSPALNAGLEVGDLVSQIGPVNIYSLDWKKELPSTVKEGISLPFVIMRKVNEERKQEQSVFLLKDGHHYLKKVIQLTPARWEGRGLLGCKLDQLSLKASKS